MQEKHVDVFLVSGDWFSLRMCYCDCVHIKLLRVKGCSDVQIQRGKRSFNLNICHQWTCVDLKYHIWKECSFVIAWLTLEVSLDAHLIWFYDYNKWKNYTTNETEQNHLSLKCSHIFTSIIHPLLITLLILYLLWKAKQETGYTRLDRLPLVNLTCVSFVMWKEARAPGENRHRAETQTPYFHVIPRTSLLWCDSRKHCTTETLPNHHIKQ